MSEIDYRLECGCVVYTDGARTFCDDCGWEVRPRAPANQADHDYPMSAVWRGIPAMDRRQPLSTGNGPATEQGHIIEPRVENMAYIEARMDTLQGELSFTRTKIQEHVAASTKKRQAPPTQARTGIEI